MQAEAARRRGAHAHVWRKSSAAEYAEMSTVALKKKHNGQKTRPGRTQCAQQTQPVGTTIKAAQRTVIPHKKTGGRSPNLFDPPALKDLQTSSLLRWPCSPTPSGRWTSEGKTSLAHL